MFIFQVIGSPPTSTPRTTPIEMPPGWREFPPDYQHIGMDLLRTFQTHHRPTMQQMAVVQQIVSEIFNGYRTLSSSPTTEMNMRRVYPIGQTIDLLRDVLCSQIFDPNTMLNPLRDLVSLADGPAFDHAQLGATARPVEVIYRLTRYLEIQQEIMGTPVSRRGERRALNELLSSHPTMDNLNALTFFFREVEDRHLTLDQRIHLERLFLDALRLPSDQRQEVFVLIEDLMQTQSGCAVLAGAVNLADRWTREGRRFDSARLLLRYLPILSHDLPDEERQTRIDFLGSCREAFQGVIIERCDAVSAGELDFVRTFREMNRATELIRRLGLDTRDPELQYNFAYGIAHIGEERTQFLAQTNGIRYFARYSPNILNETFENMQGRVDARPAMFLLWNQNDHNGNFYYQFQSADSLIRGYRVIIIEDSSQDVISRAVRIYPRIRGERAGMGFYAHGFSGGMRYGARDPTRPGADWIDVNDREFIRKMRAILNVPNPVIFFESCSTGDTSGPISIAEVLAQELHARAFAAPRNIRGIEHFQFDRHGQITGVVFDNQQPGDQLRIIPRRER